MRAILKILVVGLMMAFSFSYASTATDSKDGVKQEYVTTQESGASTDGSYESKSVLQLIKDFYKTTGLYANFKSTRWC